jgi:hypothetical protein
VSGYNLADHQQSTFTNKSDEYPPEYELGVWSLDALYKLQNSLNATVASLLKAKEELTAQIIAVSFSCPSLLATANLCRARGSVV